MTPLHEFSSSEYEDMGRQFVGEKIYHAPKIEFVGRPWNLTLGAVQGKLYKIAPFLELKDKTEASEAAFRALTFCNEQLGKPAEQRTGLFVWIRLTAMSSFKLMKQKTVRRKFVSHS